MSSTPNDRIVWPAVIMHAGHAELTYVHDAAQWQTERQLHGHFYATEDRLIDALGRRYRLSRRHRDRATPQNDGTHLSLPEVITLIRAHAAQMNHCCVTKFSAQSIREAISLLPTLDAD